MSMNSREYRRFIRADEARISFGGNDAVGGFFVEASHQRNDGARIALIDSFIKSDGLVDGQSEVNVYGDWSASIPELVKIINRVVDRYPPCESELEEIATVLEAFTTNVHTRLTIRRNGEYSKSTL
jgi:hypothetical protein